MLRAGLAWPSRRRRETVQVPVHTQRRQRLVPEPARRGRRVSARSTTPHATPRRNAPAGTPPRVGVRLPAPGSGRDSSRSNPGTPLLAWSAPRWRAVRAQRRRPVRSRRPRSPTARRRPARPGRARASAAAPAASPPQALAGARQVEAVAVLRSGADVPRPVRLPQHELVHIQQCAAVPARDARRHVAVAAGGHLRGPLLDARRPRAVLPLLVGQPRGPVHRRRRHDHDDARPAALVVLSFQGSPRTRAAARARAPCLCRRRSRRTTPSRAGGPGPGGGREERRGQLPRPARVVAAVAPIIPSARRP